MKQYTGDVFTDHLYPAARNYTTGMFQWHMKKIFDFAPDTIEYLETHHSRIWYRCGFSENSKCDYLTNNVVPSLEAPHLESRLGQAVVVVGGVARAERPR